MSADLGAAACAYAAEGLYIFPLYPLGFPHPLTGEPSDGKKPATPKGSKTPASTSARSPHGGGRTRPTTSAADRRRRLP